MKDNENLKMSNQVIDNILTKSALKKIFGEFDLELLNIIDLNNLSIGDIGKLEECINVEFLSISQNILKSVSNFACFIKLKFLDISQNKISSLEGLQNCAALENLDASGNNLSNLNTLKFLSGLENLSVLRLYNSTKNLSNPICMGSNYREDALHMLPRLKQFDGEYLIGTESEVFKKIKEMEKFLISQEALSVNEIVFKSHDLKSVPIRTYQVEPAIRYKLTSLNNEIERNLNYILQLRDDLYKTLTDSKYKELY